jgi:hypothetical protein
VGGGVVGGGVCKRASGVMCKNPISSSSSRNKVYLKGLSAKYINAVLDDLDFLGRFAIL